MIRLLIILFTILLTYNNACSASRVLKVSKSEDKDSIQTFISFDQIPPYETQLNGKRLDIILQSTLIEENASFFKEDDKIVKILTRPSREDTEISLFFRYIPQDVSFYISQNNTLVADIHLGNRFTRTYRDLSSSLKGVTVLKRSTEDFTNPLVSSPYAHDWRTFFSSYETDVTISPSVRFYIPKFPVSRLLKLPDVNVFELLPDELFALAEKEKWAAIATSIEKSIGSISDIESKKIFALIYGEILLRNDNFEGAYKQLYLLKNNYSKEQAGQLATYLLSLLLAVNGDPYSANYELRLLIEKMIKTNPLYAYVNLLLAETSLATNQLDKMGLATRRDDIGYPEEIESKRELRQADLYFATDQPVKAFVAYKLVSQQNNLHENPFSLNGFCETLYKQKSYNDSAECYNKLAELTNSREQLGMIYFRSAMARLKNSEDSSELINDFSRIEDAFPGTEAGFRAAVKKTDLRYLARKDWSATAIKYYSTLADKSIYREVSAESYFKEALLYHFSGDNGKSIELTSTLLRNFRSGPIRASAEALLIQLLPVELKRLVDDKAYTDALALARQHRRFFENNWLNFSILAGLGYSYHQLGLYSDALQLYLYLMEISGTKDKEQYFLPLTQVAYDKGDYALVQDYATQYNYYYPEGLFKESILYLQLKSMLADNQIDQAINLIPEPLPDQDNYKFLSASLFFRKDDYQTVASILKPFWNQNIPLAENLTFILAESLFQLGNSFEAEPIFQETKKVVRYAGQSLYRLAEISRQNGNEPQALKFYAAISQTEDNTLWKKFAERELKFNQLSQNL